VSFCHAPTLGPARAFACVARGEDTDAEHTPPARRLSGPGVAAIRQRILELVGVDEGDDRMRYLIRIGDLDTTKVGERHYASDLAILRLYKLAEPEPQPEPAPEPEPARVRKRRAYYRGGRAA
jgi:hypothetical protein